MQDILREFHQILILAQKRGGKGIQAMSTKEDDFVEHVMVTSTHQMYYSLQTEVEYIN